MILKLNRWFIDSRLIALPITYDNDVNELIKKIKNGFLQCWLIVAWAHFWSCCRTNGIICDWRRSNWKKRSGNATCDCRDEHTTPNRSADWSSKADGRKWWTVARWPVAGPGARGWRWPRGTIRSCWWTLAAGAKRSWVRRGHSWPCRWWLQSTWGPSGTAPGTCSTVFAVPRWFR